MKKSKFKKLVNELEEFIADHEMSNRHYLTNADIFETFSGIKKKTLRKALKEVR